MKPSCVSWQHVRFLDSYVNVLPQCVLTSRVHLRGERVRLKPPSHLIIFVSKTWRRCAGLVCHLDEVYKVVSHAHTWILVYVQLYMWVHMSFCERALKYSSGFTCAESQVHTHTHRLNRAFVLNQTRVCRRVGIFTCVYVVRGPASPLPPSSYSLVVTDDWSHVLAGLKVVTLTLRRSKRRADN